MKFILGYLTVIGGVLGGYIWHGGSMAALNQPAEFLIIGGAAIGAFIVANPVHNIRAEAQFGRIVGLADSAPYDVENPENPANRRISIVVLNRATERAIGLNERQLTPEA